jgi:probable rRNA maturation factor
MLVDVSIIRRKRKLWRAQSDAVTIRSVVCAVLSYFPYFACSSAVVSVTVLLTDDEEVRNLNLIHRQRDSATNVLSFPDKEMSVRKLYGGQLSCDIEIGDIAFAYETVRREAMEHEKVFRDHFIHLLVHSVLHLIGFDHQTSDEADHMESLEEKILLEKFSIPSPYL